MINAIIIDDEVNALKTLENDIQDYCPEVKILDLCNSAKSGIQSIKKHQPDLIFLDIEMPDQNGFDMLKTIGTFKFKVIFTTAHSQFAIDAFRLSAVVDYLLKPIAAEQLKEAVNRVLSQQAPVLPITQLEVLFEHLINGKELKRIALRTGNGLDFVLIQDIIYASSEANYITVYKLNENRPKPPYCTVSLKYLEERLSNFGFCRIHQSHLINLNHMVNFNRQEHFVLMMDGKKLPVSRNGKTELLRKLDDPFK